MERPPRFTELLRRLVASWTSKPVGFEIEEKTLGIGCCDGSLDNPGLTRDGKPCRRSPHHDTYWNLYDQLKDNDLL